MNDAGMRCYRPYLVIRYYQWGGGGGGADVGHSLTIVSPQIGYLSAFATNICSATNWKFYLHTIDIFTLPTNIWNAPHQPYLTPFLQLKIDK